MQARAYDEWYQTPRGRWIGGRETELIAAALEPRPGESLLDVGCGTGYFTRALAQRADGPVVGVDLARDWVAYARRRDGGRAAYAVADARALPFADASFDLVASVTALCFIEEEAAALREILRVTRRRFAIGMLHRPSLLWWSKGRRGGRGGYAGARWHGVESLRALFRGTPVRGLRLRTAIHFPGGGPCARWCEPRWPAFLRTGGFLLASGELDAGARGGAGAGAGARSALP